MRCHSPNSFFLFLIESKEADTSTYCVVLIFCLIYCHRRKLPCRLWACALASACEVTDIVKSNLCQFLRWELIWPNLTWQLTWYFIGEINQFWKLMWKIRRGTVSAFNFNVGFKNADVKGKDLLSVPDCPLKARGAVKEDTGTGI